MLKPRNAMLVVLALAVGVHAAGAASISVDGQFISTVPTGTPPLSVASTSMVTNLNANFLQGLPASAFAKRVGHVVHVGVSGGDFTSIQAALDSITDASLANLYLILVGPGTYHESITLKNFVMVRGYGRDFTILSAQGAGAVTAVQGAPVSELSDLTINVASTTGGNATGIQSPLLLGERLLLTATSTGQATGVRVTGTDNVELHDCDVTASDGTVNTGVFVETPAYFTAKRGSLRAQGFSNPASTNYGVRRSFVSGYSTLILEDVAIAGVGGDSGFGVRSEKGGMGLKGCNVSADGSTQAIGVYNGENTTFGVSDTSFFVTGSAPASARIGFEQAAGTVEIRNSTFNSAIAIDVAGGAQARLAYNQIFVSLTGSGTYNCIGNYDLGMAPVSCP